MYSILGNSYLRLNINDKAANYYQKSLSMLEVKPQENIGKISNVHLSLGAIYNRASHIDEAL